jgi:hypothetical protein
MQAKSFLGTMRDSARHFYSTTVRGEVSDANIQGYLRAASQIEDLWQQIDEQLAQRSMQGVAPWEAYRQLGYPLAFVRAARTYQIFVKELLAADAAFDPQTAGYLPQITYDQANALCQQIQPALQEAVAALNDPRFVPDRSLPLVLEPRVEHGEQPCPVTHLQGIIGAAREVREWAAGLIAQYEQTVRQAKTSVSGEITAHITALQGRLAQADSQLRFGTDFAGQVSQGQATPEMHMQAEDSLWDALQNYFLLNQAVALPELLRPAQSHRLVSSPERARGAYHDLRISPEDLWHYSSPSARSELYGTAFGTREMGEMWEKMGGILSARAQQYLDEVGAALACGEVYPVAAMANCPFEPIYRTRRPLTLTGTIVPSDNEFHWNFHRDALEFTRRFSRTENWQECTEEGRH